MARNTVSHSYKSGSQLWPCSPFIRVQNGIQLVDHGRNLGDDSVTPDVMRPVSDHVLTIALLGATPLFF